MENKKGYTLLEIMAVLIIIAILATLIVGSIGRYQKLSKEKYEESLVNQVELAAKSYYSYNPSELPRGQILDNQKIYETSITVKELMDKSSFSGDLVDSEGNSCNEQSYAVVRNTNNNYNYDVCLICNGKVISGTKECRLEGNPVVNKSPYCSVSVENVEHNVKKLTVYTNTLNNVVSSNVTAASDGNYYAYKPGNYNFTVKNDDGDEANCSTTVYMEEDKVKPSCNATVVSTTNTTYTVNFSYSDNISLKSVTNPKTGGKGNDYTCSYGNIVDNGYTGNIVIDRGTSDITYTMTVTDCNDNTNSCSVNVPKKVSSSGGSSGGGDICIGPACDNDCDCEDYWDYDSCVAHICNPITCRTSTQTINNCTPSGGGSSCTKVCIPGASNCDSAGRRYQCSSDGCDGWFVSDPSCTSEFNPNTSSEQDCVPKPSTGRCPRGYNDYGDECCK